MGRFLSCNGWIAYPPSTYLPPPLFWIGEEEEEEEEDDEDEDISV